MTIVEGDQANGSTLDLACVEHAELARPADKVPADRHPFAVYLAGLTSPNSRRAMTTALSEVANLLSARRLGIEEFPWAALQHQHVQAVRAALVEKHAPATVNLALSGVRGVLRACWRLGLLTADEFARATDVKRVRGQRVLRGRALSGGEVGALFAAAEERRGPAAIRDAAILAVMFGVGLRRAEVVDLRVEDLRPVVGEDDSLELVVRGKGNKQRLVYLGNGSKAAVEDWLKARGSQAGPLFLAISKSGVVRNDDQMTAQSIYALLRRHQERARIAPFSPHDARRTLISELWDRGIDGSTIAEIAGHANIATTARYDRRGERRKRTALAAVHVPYVGRRL